MNNDKVFLIELARRRTMLQLWKVFRIKGQNPGESGRMCPSNKLRKRMMATASRRRPLLEDVRYLLVAQHSLDV